MNNLGKMIDWNRIMVHNYIKFVNISDENPRIWRSGREKGISGFGGWPGV
jgi:hypothetical protein